MLAGCLCRKYLVSQINIALTRSAGGERVVVQAFRMADRARELLLVRRSKSLIRSPPPANSRWPTGGPPAYGRLRSRERHIKTTLGRIGRGKSDTSVDEDARKSKLCDNGSLQLGLEACSQESTVGALRY